VPTPYEPNGHVDLERKDGEHCL